MFLNLFVTLTSSHPKTSAMPAKNAVKSMYVQKYQYEVGCFSFTIWDTNLGMPLFISLISSPICVLLTLSDIKI